jgi:hypothetical protein
MKNPPPINSPVSFFMVGHLFSFEASSTQMCVHILCSLSPSPPSGGGRGEREKSFTLSFSGQVSHSFSFLPFPSSLPTEERERDRCLTLMWNLLRNNHSFLGKMSQLSNTEKPIWWGGQFGSLNTQTCRWREKEGDQVYCFPWLHYDFSSRNLHFFDLSRRISFDMWQGKREIERMRETSNCERRERRTGMTRKWIHSIQRKRERRV